MGRFWSVEFLCELEPVAYLFNDCKVQNKMQWMSTKYILLLVIESQGPEPGLYC